MKITNNENLPQVVVDIMENLNYPPRGADRIGVTELIGPPLVRQLKRKHWNELEEDASDGAWRLMGTAVHKLIEGKLPEHITERRCEAVFDDITVAGRADVVDGNVLYDWKITSAWHKTFADGLPDDWVKQMNAYAYLLGDITSAKVVVIYRDWQKTRVKEGDDYPPRPIMAYDIPLATKDDQLKYILKRIRLHKSDPLMCTADERWATGDTWAIYKNSNKTASRVLPSEEQAKNYLAEMKKAQPKHAWRIDLRKGIDKKCENYCPVRKFCPFKELKKCGFCGSALDPDTNYCPKCKNYDGEVK